MYQEVPTTDGLYLVDYDLINRILHDSYYLQGKNSGAQLKTAKEGWGLPETYHYEVNYPAARRYAEGMRMAFNALGRLGALIDDRTSFTSTLPRGADVERFKEELFDIERAGRDAAEALKKKQKQATRRSMRNINDKVEAWGAAVEVAKFTRDASVDVILVTGGVMSGGTALALGGTGSLLKGVYKYQDTGNVAASVMESTVSFVTFVIPSPDAGMSKGMARTLLFTKTTVEFSGKTAVGLVEGKSLGEATLSAGTDIALGALVDKVKALEIPEDEMKKLLKNGIFSHVPVPVGIRLVSGGLIGTGLGRLGEPATEKLLSIAKTRRTTGKPGLRKVAVSAPVLIDLAIAGPDRSTAPRRW